MKILIVDSYYDAFLRQHYAKFSKSANFLTLRKQLFSEHFGTSDAYSFYFKALGCESEEVIANDPVTQSAWSKENSMFVLRLPVLATKAMSRFFGCDWRFQILKEQIRKIEPDVLMIQELNILTDAMTRELKKEVSLVVSQIAINIPNYRKFDGVDLVITSLPPLVSFFKSNGKKAEFVKLGFDPRILNNLRPKRKEHDLVFVGGISSHHKERIAFLESISKKLPFKWFGYGVRDLVPDSPLRRCFQGPAWGLEMYQTLRNSRLALNFHVDIAGDYANNMRLYETTGAGTCLLTDAKSNLREIFEANQEVVVYESEEELISQALYFLKNESERERIALRGQERTLRDHTYQNRAQELIAIFKRYLAQT